MLAPHHFASPVQDRLICFADALRIIGTSRSTAYRLIAEDALPQPVKLGNRTFFSERELQSWIARKLADRNERAREPHHHAGADQ